MKKIKIAFWILVFAFLGLIIYQNRAFFQAPLSLQLNLGFVRYATPEQQIWVFFIGLFLLGILLAYLFSLPGRFSAGKNVKTLNATVTSQRNELDALKREVTAMQSPAPAQPETGQPAEAAPDGVEPQA